MQLRAFRRTLAVGAVWAVALGGLLATSPAASGQEGVDPGTGNAYAQGVKVDPRSGRLSFGITYGMSLAGHQNTVAIAESRSVDPGVIGSTLADEKCDGSEPTWPEEDQPQPLVARSSEEGSGEEQVESEYGVEKRVQASQDPYARSVAATAAAGDPAAILLGATHSLTESGLVDGARVARALTEVESVALGGGQVVLKGLRWEAVYRSAPDESTSGSFTIEGIEVGGEALPVPDEDPLASLAEANAALEPLGFRITPPEVKKESGIQFVEPLRISVIPSSARESVIGPIFNAVQPVRESVFDALIQNDCKNASYITVLDIVLGAVTGAGSLSVELGGVTASSKAIERTSFLGGLGGAPSLPPLPQGGTGSPSLGAPTSSPSLSGSAGSLSTPTTVASSDGGAAGADDGAGAGERAVADVQPLSGSRGGALAGVGLGGLALLAALAAADRAKMRQAQRSILMEVI